jgi:23S rRNA pseudouridine1911/1915/1917 synthase
LRVHLAAIGHPIVGDILYGRPDDDYLDLVKGARDPRADDGSPARHLLHCAGLVFADPAGAGEVEVVSPLPVDFAAVLGG